MTRSADDSPAAVVQGFAPEVGWTQLAEAAFALKVPEEEGGIPWIATNTDWTIPQSRGIAPGNGTLVSAVHTAIGRLATVAGKPEVPIFEEAVARFGARHPLFLGDRLDTDILGANRAGHPVGARADRHRPAQARPRGARRVAADVHPRRPARAPRAVPRGARRATAARPSAVRRVRIDGPDVRIVSAGDRPIDLLRAGAAAIWATGRAIFGFRVPERALRGPVPPALISRLAAARSPPYPGSMDPDTAQTTTTAATCCRRSR